MDSNLNQLLLLHNKPKRFIFSGKVVIEKYYQDFEMPANIQNEIKDYLDGRHKLMMPNESKITAFEALIEHIRASSGKFGLTSKSELYQYFKESPKNQNLIFEFVNLYNVGLDLQDNIDNQIKNNTAFDAFKEKLI